MKSQNSNNIQVISRAFEILRIIKKQKHSNLSLGKISKISNLPRSTVQRIVNTLIKENCIISKNGNGINLGSEIFELASEDNFDVIKALSPIINALSNRTNETIDLAILKNNNMILLDRVIGSYRLGVNSTIGVKFPLSSTANGKAALSLIDSKRAEKLLKNEFSKNKVICNIKQLGIEIAKAGISGIAYDFDENSDGISAVGTAFIINKDIYSISIPVPSHRFNLKQKELERHLRITMEKVRPLVSYK
jgi:DNA-binding IclR family transcriptional regulator